MQLLIQIPGMSTIRLSVIEKITLLFVLLMLLLGYILFYSNLHSFEIYVEEDGIVEWLTVVGLMAGCIVCASRFIKLFKTRSWWFLTVTAVLCLLLFMVAGEEISWGQRIFGIKSSSFFIKNNTQHEMNFHNLVLDGVKLNKLIFSIGLIVALFIYLGIMPIVYQKSLAVKRFIDRSGVPVARVYQVIAFLLLFILTSLLRHEKNSELMECGAASLFFLIVLFPKNKYIFGPLSTA